MRFSQMLSIMIVVILINVALATFVPITQAEEAPVLNVNGSVGYDQRIGEGKHIFFTLNETTGLISDFGINTSEGRKVLLDNISIEGFVPSEVQFLGSLVKISNEDDSLTMHDNPTGLMHAKMKQPTLVSIELAGDLVVIEERELVEEEEESYQLVLSDNITGGTIISDRPFDVRENGMVIETECKDILIRFLPQNDAERGWMETVLMEAVEDGRISAEVILAMEGENAWSEVAPYNAAVQVEVLSLQQNRFQIEMGGENAAGILLLVHAEEPLMKMVEERLRVELGGEYLQLEQEPMVLLYEHPDEPCYALIDEGDANQMLIYLPAATLGVVTVEEVSPWASLLSPAGLIMTAGAVALVLMAGFMVFRRR